MAVTDQIFVGHLGSKRLAATAIGNTYFNLMWFFLLGLSSALDTLGSQAYGAGDHKALTMWLFAGLWSMSLWCIPATALLLVGEPVARLVFRQPQDISRLVGVFCTRLAPGLWPLMWGVLLMRYLQVQNQMRLPAIAALLSFLLNILLNFLLIRALGFSGAPIATTLARLFQFLLLLCAITHSSLNHKAPTPHPPANTSTPPEPTIAITPQAITPQAIAPAACVTPTSSPPATPSSSSTPPSTPATIPPHTQPDPFPPASPHTSTLTPTVSPSPPQPLAGHSAPTPTLTPIPPAPTQGSPPAPSPQHQLQSVVVHAQQPPTPTHSCTGASTAQAPDKPPSPSPPIDTASDTHTATTKDQQPPPPSPIATPADPEPPTAASCGHLKWCAGTWCRRGTPHVNAGTRQPGRAGSVVRQCLRAGVHWALMWQFLRLGMAGALMFALEASTFELTTALAGLLGEKEVAAHTVMMGLVTFTFLAFPFAVAIAATIRVGNLLGAKQPRAAKLAAKISLVLGVGVMALVGALMIAIRPYIGRAFTTDKAVLSNVAIIVPWAAAYQPLDGFHAVSQGVLRGMGKQPLIAVVNLVGLCGVGLTTACVATFPAGMGLAGLWLGLTVGLSTVCVMYIVTFVRTDWEEEAEKAQAARLDKAAPACPASPVQPIQPGGSATATQAYGVETRVST